MTLISVSTRGVIVFILLLLPSFRKLAMFQIFSLPITSLKVEFKNVVARCYQCRKTLPEFRGYCVGRINAICSHCSSNQGPRTQAALSWNDRPGCAEHTKLCRTFGTHELLRQDSALIQCSAEVLAFSLQTKSMAMGVKTGQVESSCAVLTLRKYCQSYLYAISVVNYCGS